jgi:nuclear RNA export factor
LKRFPGLLILDGVNLNRIVFPVSRGIKERWTDELRNDLRAKPFTFPFDVQGGFMESEGVSQSIMQFCAKWVSFGTTSSPASY